MKRFLALVLILSSVLVVCLMTGCTTEIKAHVNTEETIGTNVNEEFVIALDANPTTGYNWEASRDDSMLDLVERKYSPDEKAPGLVGSGGTQYFRFKALKAGDTEMTVTYKRPWETDGIQHKVFKVNIQ